MTTIWHLPQIEITDLSSINETRPTALLTGKDAIQLAGSIQVIDAQHAAILHYVLGDYPVPDVFAKTDLAAS